MPNAYFALQMFLFSHNQTFFLPYDFRLNKYYYVVFIGIIE